MLKNLKGDIVEKRSHTSAMDNEASRPPPPPHAPLLQQGIAKNCEAQRSSPKTPRTLNPPGGSFSCFRTSSRTEDANMITSVWGSLTCTASRFWNSLINKVQPHEELINATEGARRQLSCVISKKMRLSWASPWTCLRRGLRDSEPAKHQGQSAQQC